MLIAGIMCVAATSNASASSELAASEWRPTTLRSSILPSDTPLFVQFRSQGNVLIFDGCSHYLGTYRLAADLIEIKLISGSPEPCPRLDLERVLLDVLKHAARFERRNATLSLFDAAGDVATFAQTDWD